MQFAPYEVNESHRASLVQRWARLGVPGAAAYKSKPESKPVNFIDEVRVVLGSPRTIRIADAFGDEHEFRVIQPTVGNLLSVIEAVADKDMNSLEAQTLIRLIAPVLAHCLRGNDRKPVSVEFVMELPIGSAADVLDAFLGVFDVRKLMSRLGVSFRPKARAGGDN